MTSLEEIYGAYAFDLHEFVPPDQLGISKAVVRDLGSRDVIAEAQQYFARVERDSADTPACSHNQAVVDRRGGGGRDDQRDGILELIYLEEQDHPGTANAFYQLYSVRPDDRDFRRFIEGGYQYVQRHPQEEKYLRHPCGAPERPSTPSNLGVLHRPTLVSPGPQAPTHVHPWSELSSEAVGANAPPTPVLEVVADLGAAAEGNLAAARETKVRKRLDEMEVNAEAQRLYNVRHRPRADAPAPIMLPDLLARPVNPVKYRVDRLLGVGGRILLAAAQKAGKTTLMGNLIRNLADGGLFLGQFEVTPVDGNIILLDTEMPEHQLQEWLGRLNIKNAGKVAIFSLRDRVTSFDITNPEVLAQWVEILTPLNPAFVILDCLRPVLDGAGLDEKTEAGKFLVPFGELLGRLKVEEAVLVQHMGHGAERARGDSALLGWPDANWKVLRKDAEDDRSTRYFSAFGRDVDVAESELGFNSMTGELKVAGGSRRMSALDAALDAIVTVLAAKPGLSGRAIEAELAESDHARKDIRAALKCPDAARKLSTKPGSAGSTLHYAKALTSGYAESSAPAHCSE